MSEVPAVLWVCDKCRATSPNFMDGWFVGCIHEKVIRIPPLPSKEPTHENNDTGIGGV